MTTLPFHNIVAMDGWTDTDSVHTVNLGLAGDGSVLTQLDEGMAMTIDVTGPNKFRPCVDGEMIYGYLVRVEQRALGSVGSIAFHYIQRHFLLAADAGIVGDPVVGSTGGVPNASRGGWVKKDVSATAAINQSRIMEKGTDTATGFTYVVVLHAI
jgi:hypothetical protein